MTLCTAHSSRTGLPCQKHAIFGATVCRTHGGASPQVQRTVRERLEEEAVSSLQRLVELRGQSSELSVALRAAMDLLDRAGYKPTDKLKLSGDTDEPLEIIISRPNVPSD